MRAIIGTSLGLLLVGFGDGHGDNAQAVFDKTTVADDPSKSCMSAMRGVCDGKYEDLCKQCAGEHAQELLQAGCTNAAIRTICQDGLLASVNLTIGHDYADLVLQVGHINDEANSANQTGSQNALPSSMCFDSTDDPNNYFIYGHRLSFLQAGGVRVDQALLQLRATGVDSGVLGTSASLSFADWTSSFGEREYSQGEPRFRSNISCADQYGCRVGAGSTAMTSANLHIGQTFRFHKWSIKLNGICEN